jgi:hypothetical protein
VQVALSTTKQNTIGINRYPISSRTNAETQNRLEKIYHSFQTINSAESKNHLSQTHLEQLFAMVMANDFPQQVDLDAQNRILIDAQKNQNEDSVAFTFYAKPDLLHDLHAKANTKTREQGAMVFSFDASKNRIIETFTRGKYKKVIL